MAFRSPAPQVGFVLASVMALAFLRPLAAQAPASELLLLTRVTLKPGMIQAYVDYQKSEVIPALQKGGQTWRQSWRTAVFGDTFEVAHVSPITNMDQFDNPSPLRKALGEQGFAAYAAKISTMVSSQRSYAIRTRPDLSYHAVPGSAPKMAILTVVQVRPDRLMDFETFLKGEWISALKKGGGKEYSVVQVVYGGSTTEYHTLVGIDSFAELGKGHPVTQALGEDGVVKMMSRSGAFTEHIDRRIIRLDTDLTFEVNGPSGGR